MSLPTIYTVKNDEGKVLGHVSTKYFIMFPISLKDQPERFYAEAGELLVTDVARYCSGKQASAPSPKFSLADVASFGSEGGSVERSDFAMCIDAYIKQREDRLSEADREEALQVKKEFEAIVLNHPVRPAPGSAATNPAQKPE